MIALLLLLSCVPKADFELARVQLDATRSALSARNAACYEDRQAQEQRTQVQAIELAACQADRDRVQERTDQLGAEVEAARASLAEVVSAAQPEDAEPLVPAVIVDALALRSRSQYIEARRLARFTRWQDAFAELQAQGRLTLLQDQGRLIVRVPTVQIFNEGRVSISPRGTALLVHLAQVLADAPGEHIQVAAHTDGRPFHTAEFASSWELGFAEAMTVVRALKGAGVSVPLSVASYASEEPLASDDTAEGRKQNRRIELILWSPPVQVPSTPALPTE